MISVKNHHIPATILVDIALNIHTDHFKCRLQIIKIKNYYGLNSIYRVAKVTGKIYLIFRY